MTAVQLWVEHWQAGEVVALTVYGRGGWGSVPTWLHRELDAAERAAYLRPARVRR